MLKSEKAKVLDMLSKPDISEKDFLMLKEMTLKADSSHLRVQGLRMLWSAGGTARDSSGRYPAAYQEIFKESATRDPDAGVRGVALELVRDTKFLETRALLDDSLLARSTAKNVLESMLRNPEGVYLAPGWEY